MCVAKMAGLQGDTGWMNLNILFLVYLFSGSSWTLLILRHVSFLSFFSCAASKEFYCFYFNHLLPKLMFFFFLFELICFLNLPMILSYYFFCVSFLKTLGIGLSS